MAALKDLALDDSRKVAHAAAEALKTHDEEAGRIEVGPLPKAPAAEEKALDHESPETPDDRAGGHSSDIFISYAHEDRDKARALANVLVARGWKVWWDRKIAPGEAFDEVIGGAQTLQVRHRVVVGSFSHAVGENNPQGGQAGSVPVLILTANVGVRNRGAESAAWKAAGDHPEFESVLDRIQALSPIPDERLARSAVEGARREFAAGRRQPALASLEAFHPNHALVTRALAELREQAERIERDRAETVRQQAEAADRQRAIVAEETRIEGLLVGLDLDAAERALVSADETFDRPAEFLPCERLDILRRWANTTSRPAAGRRARAFATDVTREAGEPGAVSSSPSPRHSGADRAASAGRTNRG